MNTIERTKKGELMNTKKPLIDYCANPSRRQASERKSDPSKDLAEMIGASKWCGVLFACCVAWYLILALFISGF